MESTRPRRRLPPHNLLYIAMNEKPVPHPTSASSAHGERGAASDAVSVRDRRRIEPTARGDMLAEKVRDWYEANRESWWDRHRPNADRKGIHADEFMLRFVAAVYQAEREIAALEQKP